MQIHTTAIIRDRGQLTIPLKIRRQLNWLTPNCVVTLTVTKDKKILVSPYVATAK